MVLFETDDERRQRLRDQSLGGDSVLRDGERMRIGMLLTDSAALPGPLQQKDTAMTMTLTDAVAQVPAQFQYKVMHAIGALGGSGPAARWAIDDANGLIMQMEMTAAGHYGGAEMTTDAAKGAVTICVDHLRSAIQATDQRLRAQGL